MLERLARLCVRHRLVVVLGWLAFLILANVAVSVTGPELTNEFGLPGAESQTAADLLQSRFPGASGGTSDIVVRADAGLDDPTVQADVETLRQSLLALDHVVEVSPLNPSPLGAPIGFMQIRYDLDERSVPLDVPRAVIDLVDRSRRPGLEVEAGGEIIRDASQEPPGSSEVVGLVAAVIVLLITFGSVVAMTMPMVTALFALGSGLALVRLADFIIDIPEFGPNLATMIGLGVGIDYALFIVTRYRRALAEGLEVEEAVAQAARTAGRATMFAGITVVISLMGLSLVGLSFMNGMSVGAAATVLTTMVAAVTLLPALLGWVGTSINRARIPLLKGDGGDPTRSVWYRWSRLVENHPWPVAIVGSGLLLLLTVPMFSIRLGFTDAGNDPPSATTRRAYDLLAEGFGPGFNGRLVVAIETNGDPSIVDRLAQATRETPGVFAVPEVTERNFSQVDPEVAVITVIPDSAPQDSRTDQLIDRLRHEVYPEVLAGTGARASVGGITASFTDISRRLTSRLPIVIGAVLTLSFLLLMAVFRSVLVPLKAVVMNLLSIGAAYGVVVAVFQWGWGAGIIGVDRTGPIVSFAPVFMFAVLFGLSMDYEVFLLSRVHEEYVRTGDNAEAVADGLASTARVITAAALIMTTVFGSFAVLGDDATIKLFGVGLATAIIVDATLVRVLLVPATMELMGDANWWFPSWLDRLIPRLNIEAPVADQATESIS